MDSDERPPGAWRARFEVLIAVALVWLLLASIPVALGGIGLSWDALNHHFYLGWTADGARFDRDFLAASYQSFQYPYLYWPAYKLAQAGVSGATAGLVLVTLHVTVVPALWLIARTCIAGDDHYARVMRLGAVVLGVSGELFLSLMDTTANDGLAAIPLVWAVALAMRATIDDALGRLSHRMLLLVNSGLLAGISVAFKFSNGPVAILLPLLWLGGASNWRTRLANAAIGSAATLIGFVVAYGYWGWELWQHFGNPIYPFRDDWFAGARAWAGWKP